MRMFFGGIKVFLAIALFLGALSPLGAGAAEKIGVLLLHGKAHGNKSISHLSGKLESAGFLVEMPSSTPWSPNRIYDRTYLETLKELDAAVDKLKAAGATRVVVGGHSIGANVALGCNNDVSPRSHNSSHKAQKTRSVKAGTFIVNSP